MEKVLRSLYWIEELLPDNVIQKNMNGGVGYYLDEKLILMLVDYGSSYEHKGIAYPFMIWNGVFFPIEKIKQSRVFLNFSFLENHPASDKWLYLPADTEDFEERVQLLMREIKKRNPLFGLLVKMKRPRAGENEEGDLSKPSLFADEPVARVVKKKKEDQPKKKIKADKKRENNLVLSVLKRTRT